jgi:hypothetical protein
MKNKHPLLFLIGLILINLLSNSCKKDTQGTVQSLLARGTWQLASVLVYNYVGSNNTSTDTLNTDCANNQTFTFNADNTCSYLNFSCIKQVTTGTWQLSQDNLTLESTMMCHDTVRTTVDTITTPFRNARIINLGQYSLILETGDINGGFLPTDKRHIKRYGFVRL